MRNEFNGYTLFPCQHGGWGGDGGCCNSRSVPWARKHGLSAAGGIEGSTCFVAWQINADRVCHIRCGEIVFPIDSRRTTHGTTSSETG